MALLPPTFHPIFVHFTIALFVTAAIFATLAAWRRMPWAQTATLWLLALGVFITVATVSTGLFEGERQEELVEESVEGVIETHETLGLVTASYYVLVTAWAIWKRKALTGTTGWAFVALLWLGVLVVAITGLYGGQLVYEHGVGTPSVSG